MKISKTQIRKYIRSSLLNEITDLETGSTDFVTTKYEQCPKIIVPPIFKDLFIDKVYGQNPNEMRNNLSRRYSELADNKQTAVLFAQAMSDDNINTIMGYLNDFMNIAGVPAMFCKFLQMAIDAAAEVIDLLRLESRGLLAADSKFMIATVTHALSIPIRFVWPFSKSR